MRRNSRNADLSRPARTLLGRVGLAGVAVAIGAGVWIGVAHRGKATRQTGAPNLVAALSQPTPLAAPNPPAPLPVSAPAPADARMSASLQAAFDGWLIETYRHCWSPPKSNPDGEPYLPRVRVSFKTDGALAGPPKLVNPPFDTAWKPQADAALRAIKTCDPIHVPEKYVAYYGQWKTKIIHFDPARP